MRHVLSLALAAAAAITILGCGETEEVTQSQQSPSATASATATPAASDTPTPTQQTSPTPTASATPGITLAPTPTGTITLSTYSDPEFDFSLQYPSGWTISTPQVSPSDAELGILKRVEFRAKDGLPHIRLVVGDNAGGLSLADWVRSHDAIFFDTDPQDITIDGSPALFQPLSLGLPSPRAWVLFDSQVLGVFGLTQEDYEIIDDTIRLQ